MQFLPTGKKLILASKSPRRQQLMRELGYSFEVRTQAVAEDYHPSLQGKDIAEFLAAKKAGVFKEQLSHDEIVLTSDTVVWCDGESLAKAADEDEARVMLLKLSGRCHEVITGVCLLSQDHSEIFSATTRVCFRKLSEDEINYYIRNFSPYDKAGAYGIQEWIGMWAIEKIEGSYFNVVGLPTHLLPAALQKFS